MIESGKYEPPKIAYGIDIGTYRHTKAGNVKSNSAFAWGRVEASAKLVSSQENDSTIFSISNAEAYKSGNDMRVLADLICDDLIQKKRIAIAMEAPMWQPVPEFKTDSEYDLFPIRLDAEKGYQWYLQSGASALARAISTGITLFSILNQKYPLNNVSFSTTGKVNVDIELFEGFVAGDWKLDQAAESSFSPHCWDALLTGLGFHYAKDESRGLSDCATMHQPGAFNDNTHSHWHTILSDLEINSENCKTDCLIVGFNKHKKELHDLTDLNSQP